MKVELLLADDHELRQAVKDLIKSEVVSIARSEIKGIIADVVAEGILPKSREDVDSVVQKAVYDLLKQSISDHRGSSYGRDGLWDLIKKEAIKQVGDLINSTLEIKKEK